MASGRLGDPSLVLLVVPAPRLHQLPPFAFRPWGPLIRLKVLWSSTVACRLRRARFSRPQSSTEAVPAALQPVVLPVVGELALYILVSLNRP